MYISTIDGHARFLFTALDDIFASFQDMGTVVLGKVESGMMKKGQQLILMPNRVGIHF